MNQRKYALELVAEAGLGNAKPVMTPLESNVKLTSTKYDEDTLSSDVLYEDVGRYQRLVGKLLYLTITRPNIAFVVQSLS